MDAAADPGCCSPKCVDPESRSVFVDASSGCGVLIGPDEIVCGPVEGVAKNRTGVRANERGMEVTGRRSDEDALSELANMLIGLDIVVWYVMYLLDNKPL